MKKPMSCGLWILLLLPQTLFAGVGSAELIENGLQYHGKTIEYAGEVIGDLMARKNHAWINVNDGNNAIGIWSERAIIPPLEYLGSYANRGDTVLVRGVFHRSCPEHGGDMDIHASAITIVAAGGPVSHRTSASAVLAAAALLLASLGSYAMYKRKEKARREFPARTP